MEEVIGRSVDEEAGDSMIGVEWKKLSSHSLECKEGNSEYEEEEEECDSMIGVESKKSASDSSEDEEEVDPMISVESEDEEEGDAMIVVESKKSESNSLEDEEEVGPIVNIELTKPMEDAAEEGDPMIGVELKKLSFEEDLSNLLSGAESNQMPLDSDLSIDLGAPFEPRRSSRNPLEKNKPSPQLVKRLEISSGKKKLASKIDQILLQAIVLIIPCSKS